MKADYERFLAEHPATLSAEERAAIRRLASDIPALWRAPTTTAADRQAIIRQLVERVIVTVRGESEQVDVQIHWIGGHGTQAVLTRPVARLDQLSYLLPAADGPSRGLACRRPSARGDRANAQCASLASRQAL
ncbi:MAG: hypothetical protein WAN46_17105 [Gammaproteobacteria bacterium]